MAPSTSHHEAADTLTASMGAPRLEGFVPLGYSAAAICSGISYCFSEINFAHTYVAHHLELLEITLSIDRITDKYVLSTQLEDIR